MDPSVSILRAIAAHAGTLARKVSGVFEGEYRLESKRLLTIARTLGDTDHHTGRALDRPLHERYCLAQREIGQLRFDKPRSFLSDRRYPLRATADNGSMYVIKPRAALQTIRRDQRALGAWELAEAGVPYRGAARSVDGPADRSGGDQDRTPGHRRLRTIMDTRRAAHAAGGGVRLHRG